MELEGRFGWRDLETTGKSFPALRAGPWFSNVQRMLKLLDLDVWGSEGLLAIPT